MKIKTSMKNIIGAALLLAGVSQGTVITTLPFIDSFENGNISNSDSITDAWANQNIDSLITESGGSLNFDLDGFNGDSEFRYIQTDVSSTIDFFTQAITYSVSDISFIEADHTNQNLLMFTVSSGIGGQGAVNDGFFLKFRGDGNLLLTRKQNGTQTTFSTNSWSGTLTGFALTLDSESYEMSWTTTLDGTQVISGDLGLTAADWGTQPVNSGVGSSFAIQFQKAGGSINTVGSIGGVEIAIPEPVTMGMLGVGSAVLFLIRRRMN